MPESDRRFLTCASASMSIMSRPSATRAAAAHPDPVRAAQIAIEAGADGITAHLREDRRHIRDDDIARLKAEIAKPLNFEMAATDEMVRDRARRPGRMRPAWCRSGAKSAPPKAGSTWSASTTRWRRGRAGCDDAGIRVSLFIAAEPAQIEAAASRRRAGDRNPHRRLVRRAGRRAMRRGRSRVAAHPHGAQLARRLGLEVHAGHGLDYATAETIAALPEIVELNIGHFLIGEAVFVGLARRVRQMRAAMDRGRTEVEAAHDPRHRLRPDRHPPDRQGDRAARRPLPRSHLHRRRAGARPSAAPSAVDDLCQALRRQGGLLQGAGHRHPRAACAGATWAWSTCRPGVRPCS